MGLEHKILYDPPVSKNATLVEHKSTSRALRKLSYSAVVPKQNDADNSQSHRMNFSQFSIVSETALEHGQSREGPAEPPQQHVSRLCEQKCVSAQKKIEKKPGHNFRQLRDIMRPEANGDRSQKSRYDEMDRSASRDESVLDQSIQRIEASTENLRHLQSVRELNEMENLRLEASEQGKEAFPGVGTVHSEAKRPARAADPGKFASYPERGADPVHHNVDKRRRNGVESALNEMNMSGLTHGELHHHARFPKGTQTQDLTAKDMDMRAASVDVNAEAAANVH